MIEAIACAALYLLIVGSLLLIAYLQFGQVWIQYQSEQALYCVAEGQSSAQCRTKLEARVEEFLPWGKIDVQLASAGGKWKAKVDWQWKEYSFHFEKELSPELLLKRKALRW